MSTLCKHTHIHTRAYFGLWVAPAETEGSVEKRKWRTVTTITPSLHDPRHNLLLNDVFVFMRNIYCVDCPWCCDLKSPFIKFPSYCSEKNEKKKKKKKRHFAKLVYNPVPDLQVSSVRASASWLVTEKVLTTLHTKDIKWSTQCLRILAGVQVVLYSCE